MAWEAEQRTRCATCHTFPWEWDDDPNAYTADLYTCRGCERRDHRVDQFQSQDPDPAIAYGVKVALYPKGVVERGG